VNLTGFFFILRPQNPLREAAAENVQNSLIFKNTESTENKKRALRARRPDEKTMISTFYLSVVKVIVAAKPALIFRKGRQIGSTLMP
jgi:hypothetical protein